MSKWMPVKQMKPDKVRLANWGVGAKPNQGALMNAYIAAENYMRRGFLPPYCICLRLLDPEHQPEVLTRRHIWVLAGAMETVDRLATDTAQEYTQKRQELLALQRKAKER